MIWAGETQQGVVETEGPVQLPSAALPAGKHELTYALTFGLYHDDMQQSPHYEPRGQPFATKTVITTAEFTLMADKSEDPLERVTDTHVEKRLRELMDLSGLSSGSRGEKAVALSFVTEEGIPVAIAFDGVVLVGKRQIPAGDICYEQATWLADSIVKHFFDLDFDYTKAKLILRPNATLARKTAGISSIWGEELVVEAHEIGRTQSAEP